MRTFDISAVERSYSVFLLLQPANIAEAEELALFDDFVDLRDKI